MRQQESAAPERIHSRASAQESVLGRLVRLLGLEGAGRDQTAVDQPLEYLIALSKKQNRNAEIGRLKAEAVRHIRSRLLGGYFLVVSPNGTTLAMTAQFAVFRAEDDRTVVLVDETASKPRKFDVETVLDSIVPQARILLVKI